MNTGIALLMHFFCIAGTLDKMNDKKTWTELKKLVKDSKKQIAALSARVPANVTFRKIDDNKIRIYFLSSQSNGRESTIFYADLLQNTLQSVFFSLIFFLLSFLFLAFFLLYNNYIL